MLWLIYNIVVSDVCRQSVSSDDSNSSQYTKTLSEYDRFEDEMAVVDAVWSECKKLIEAYNEQQVCVFLCLVCMK